MKNMKKVLSVLVCIVMVLSFVISSSAATAPIKVDNKTFEITISSWYLDTMVADASAPNPNKDYVNAFTKIFKAKYPNATVTLNNSTGEKYFELLKAQLASNTAADVFFSQHGPIPLSLLDKGGYAVDLKNEPWAKDVIDVLKVNGQAMYNGKMLTAPADAMGGWGLWYNKKMFTANKIKAPVTYDDVLKACAVLKSKGIVPFSFGFKDTWTANGVAVILSEALLNLVNPNFGKELYSGKRKMTDPQMVKIFTEFQMLKDKGYVNKNALSIGWDQSRAEFIKGKGAMMIQGNWLPSVVKNEDKNFEIGFIPLSNKDGRTHVGADLSTYISVNAGSKLISESKYLVASVLDKTPMSMRLKDNGASPYKSITVKHTIAAFIDYSNAVGKSVVIPGNGYVPYLPASVHADIANEIIKIASGKKFDKKNLEKIQSNYNKDKATIILP